MIDLSEYRLETIRKDDEFILYSGTRKTDATASSIFVLTPALEHPAVACLRGIEHEYSLQAELDPDWAVIPIGLVKHDGRTMLVLANSGNSYGWRSACQLRSAGCTNVVSFTKTSSQAMSL
jgi:hypothetical protein